MNVESAVWPEALSEVRALFIEYQRSLGIDLEFQNFSAELSGLPGAYAAPRGALLLARLGGLAAGCVALRPFDEKACEMKRLYVRPQFRAAGTGRLLAQKVISAAKAIGYARMVLDTLPSMTQAQALYSSLGFRDVEPYCYNPIPGTRYMALEL